MESRKQEALIWLIAIIGIAAVICAWVLIWKITALAVPILILLPVLSYAIIKGHIPFLQKGGHAPAYIMISAGLIAFTMFMNRDSQYAFYAEPFVDGKVVEKEVWIEPDEGGGYEDTKRVYVPNTKKGENALQAIKLALTVIAIGSVVLTGRFFLINQRFQQ